MATGPVIVHVQKRTVMRSVFWTAKTPTAPRKAKKMTAWINRMSPSLCDVVPAAVTQRVSLLQFDAS